MKFVAVRRLQKNTVPEGPRKEKAGFPEGSAEGIVLKGRYRNKKQAIYIYIYIGDLEELVRFIRPPVTGRSASFRLRFRFVRAVRAVRASEARRSCEGVRV